MTEWTRRPVDVDGHQVMTYTAGTGPRTLLMVHGGPGCPSRYLRDSHKVLVGRGLRLVTWDQLGCGESDRAADPALWTIDRFVSEMETVRSALDLDVVDILGQSWGGVLGLEYVLRHPDNVGSFIAADTAFDLPRMQRGFDRKKDALGAETVTMMARHESEGTTDHPEYQAAVTLLMYRHVCRLHPWPESLMWCMNNIGEDVFTTMFGPYFFQCTGTLRAWDRMDDLGEITAPVLIVHGEHDYIVPELAAMACDRLPNAELAYFPGCSHMPFFEAPQRYLDTVAGFLRVGNAERAVVSTHITDQAALYGTAAADIYAAFRAMPASTSVADDHNAMQAVEQAVQGRSDVRIVDLGCGPGLRTREIAAVAGVSVAVGIDHSREQLNLARAEPVPGNCCFAFGDLVALGEGRDEWADGVAGIESLLGTFDVAFMGFVTSHAAAQHELDAMLRAAAAFLRPGGQLIVIDAHPDIDSVPFPPCEQYGVRKTAVLPAGHRGAVPAFTPIRVTFVTPKGELTVEDYFHDAGSWSAAAEAAGLSELVVEDFSAPPTAEPGFWDGYVRPDHPAGCSQGAVIRAVKPDRTHSAIRRSP